MLAFGISANAAEIRVLSSNALKSALEEIGPQFEKASGHKLMMVWGAAVPLRAQIEKGEVFDATILNTPGIDALVSQGKLDSATRTALVRSSIGVAVRKGAPKPDISTTEAFKTALRNAKSIAYVEQGASGIYLKEFVANGEAEIGMTQISEILPFAGADLVGPLPADIQLYTSFAGANSAATKQPDAGKAFFKFLVSPDTAKIMKAKGLEPTS